MRSTPTRKVFALAATFQLCLLAYSQEQFVLDTTFRAVILSKNVNSMIPVADGKVILTGGRMHFQGEFSDMGLVRLNADGTRDETFFNSGYGGSKLVTWNDRFYVGGYVRRILYTGIRTSPSSR